MITRLRTAWLLCLSAATICAQPDMILTNGKVVTVDDRFAIAQAVAIRGERITAVGTNQEITRMAGPNTRRIDLRGRTVLPGLIDNHMHFLRAVGTWTKELRWDSLESRRRWPFAASASRRWGRIRRLRAWPARTRAASIFADGQSCRA